MRQKLMMFMMTALFAGSPLMLSAQHVENRADRTKRERPSEEEMLQMRSRQMANTLMLDDATAAKFAPVYQNYLKEMRALTPPRNAKARKNEGESLASKGTLTDDEAARLLKDRFAKEQQRLDIQQKYSKEFSKILAPKQVLKIFRQQRPPRMAQHSRNGQPRFGQSQPRSDQRQQPRMNGVRPQQRH
ncbi:MAG: hypothetical protein LBN06_06745 [Prevotellaceae bacterium]|jgi:hypothetical protein|nr:hypothetical protein [Prevotellaceae bacterium]